MPHWCHPSYEFKREDHLVKINRFDALAAFNGTVFIAMRALKFCKIIFNLNSVTATCSTCHPSRSMAILTMSSVLNSTIKANSGTDRFRFVVPWPSSPMRVVPGILKNVEDEFEDRHSLKLPQVHLSHQYKFHRYKFVALEEISSHGQVQDVPKDLLYVVQNWKYHALHIEPKWWIYISGLGQASVHGQRTGILASP